MENKEDIYIELILLKKCTGDQLSSEELVQFSLWLQASPKHVTYYEKMMQFPYKEKEQISADLDTALQKFQANRATLPQEPVVSVIKNRTLFRIRTIAASVAAVLFIGGSIWLGIQQKEKEQQPIAIHPSTSVQLITKQGLQVNLEEPTEKLNEVLPEQIKVENNTLSYLAEKVEQAPQHYTLITPLNKQYTVALADGTIVTLNQGSEIQYTVPFQGDQRQVQLKGEAYFEVAKGEKPFVVFVNDLQVKAYGTEFNVNAYQRETIKTLLIEGSIGLKSAKGPGETILKPQEMATVNMHTGNCLVKEVSSQGALAWKTGAFSFKTVRLDEIMESIGDHFGISQIQYEHAYLKSQKLSAYITTERNISEVLEWIATTTALDITLRNGVVLIKEKK